MNHGQTDSNNVQQGGETLRPNNAPILTVMSNAKDDFISRYDVIREIGKGGFSTVYQCRHKVTKVDYAVKVVDLRPLRLRERFNPTRLKREVEIMRRLKHPNIVQFIEVYEDSDYLMMVLEYCPGTELFDVILAKSKFSEVEARPIFAQIAKALFYLHSLNIIHRDIKPENILLHKDLNPATGEPVAKLLDFGLSKNAGAGGSAGKTFVGTPCYLAPEVEQTQKGGGSTYGLAADCWSLGAVLYVMLVGRFPEFERDFAGKVVVRLNPALWGMVSENAKDLVRSLMNTNQFARITMANVLKHPWMERFQMTQSQIEAATLSCYYLGRGLQEEEEQFEELAKATKQRADSDLVDVEMTANGVVYEEQAMVIRTGPRNVDNGSAGNGNGSQNEKPPEALPLAPLLQLQRSIATCFEEAHEAYSDIPQVASQVRKGAALCREQLTVSTKMLRKVEQTANAVLSMFPDLELAIEEDEPKLAAELFGMVKGWVAELGELVKTTQAANKASMDQIQDIVENSTTGLISLTQARKKASAASTITMPKRLLGVILGNLNLGDAAQQKLLIGNGDDAHPPGAAVGEEEESIDLDANQIMDLFMSLFSVQTSQLGSTSNNKGPTPGTAQTLGSPEPDIHRHNSNNSASSIGHDRVTSIDSDTSSGMDMERRNTLSPHEFLGPRSGSAFTPVKSSAHMSEDSYHAHGTGTVDISKLPSQSSTVTLNSLQSSLETVMEDIDEGDHDHVKHIAMHVFTNTQHKIQQVQQQTHHQRIPLQLATPTPTKAITNGPAVPEQNRDNNPPSPNGRAATKLAEALQKLRQVDVILEQLSVFWANTEVVLDLLTKKGQHVEQFIGFASKPKLMARFRERIEEYKRFWEGVSIMSSNYITGVGGAPGQMTRTSSSNVTSPTGSDKMYGFLEKGVESSSGKVYYADTPPSSASKMDFSTPPPPGVTSQGNSASSSRVRRESDLGTDSSSFDSMGGIFNYIGSLDKSSPARNYTATGRSSTE
eukprot:gene29397-36446_t